MCQTHAPVSMVRVTIRSQKSDLGRIQVAWTVASLYIVQELTKYVQHEGKACLVACKTDVPSSKVIVKILSAIINTGRFL